MSKVVVISECFVRPKSEHHISEKHHYLSPLALKLLSLGNTQYGLLFNTPSSSIIKHPNNKFFDTLKSSLSDALIHFYPLAGRLVTRTFEDDHHERSCCSIFVDCNKGPGTRLIHASAMEVSVADVVNCDTDVPLVVESFFDLGERQINHEGHTRALLSVQMTELVDGLFIGCCINHCVADGTSLSHFLNVLSKIFLKAHSFGSYVPVLESPQMIYEGHKALKFPHIKMNQPIVTRYHEFISLLRDRIFMFSTASMAKLKAEANNVDEAEKTTLSSYKALCGLVWLAVTRARNLSYNETTTFVLTVNMRSRLHPPLSPTHFANCFTVATATTKVGELLTKGLGFATMLINDSVNKVDQSAAAKALMVSTDDKSTGSGLALEEPGFGVFAPNPVVMGGSPWFDFRGIDFGIGKPVAFRTGYTNRGDGKLTAFPGVDGPGSVDLQVALLPENMSALLLDDEFMAYVS